MVLYFRSNTMHKRSDLSAYEQTLLEGWEDVYKKSQLTLWLLLALKVKGRHASEIERFVSRATNGTITADTQSVYRALRRLADADVLRFELMPSTSGPDKKVYFLTESGQRLLHEFLRRNIVEVFYKPRIQAVIQGDKLWNKK